MATADIDGYLVKAQREYVYSLETGFIDADDHIRHGGYLRYSPA